MPRASKHCTESSWSDAGKILFSDVHHRRCARRRGAQTIRKAKIGPFLPVGCLKGFQRIPTCLYAIACGLSCIGKWEIGSASVSNLNDFYIYSQTKGNILKVHMTFRRICPKKEGTSQNGVISGVWPRKRHPWHSPLQVRTHY